MLPAILGLPAQLLWLKQRNDDENSLRGPENQIPYKMPWNTIFLCSICFILIFSLMGCTIALENNRCAFDGKHLMRPSDLPVIVWLGLGIYILGWLTFMILSLRRFREQSLQFRRILAIVCQLAVLSGTAGLIYYVEYNVLFAQGFLVGGNEDGWGFGQILAMIMLIVPVMEMVQHGISYSEGEDRRSRFKEWIESWGRRLTGLAAAVRGVRTVVGPG